MTFPDEPSPSLHPHYKGPHHYYETVRQQAWRRYSALTVSAAQTLPLAQPTSSRDTIHTRLPTFPTKAADHVHAASMPDTAWPIHGHPPDSSWIRSTNPVLMSFLYSRHVNNDRLRGPHLTHHARRVHIAHHDGR